MIDRVLEALASLSVMVLGVLLSTADASSGPMKILGFAMVVMGFCVLVSMLTRKRGT